MRQSKATGMGFKSFALWFVEDRVLSSICEEAALLFATRSSLRSAPFNGRGGGLFAVLFSSRARRLEAATCKEA